MSENIDPQLNHGRLGEHFRLRLDPEQRRWIRIQAEKNLRSMTAEINIAIRTYRARVEREEAKAAAE